MVERAERRLAGAEQGARVLREQAAQQAGAAQREVQDRRRDARAQAASIVAEARAEADDLRTRARELLDGARAEVRTLTLRRDRIAAELGQLSGVIDALAVPDPSLAAPPTDDLTTNDDKEPDAR
jgi:vacuolar-type H+-ATPase subunit H